MSVLSRLPRLSRSAAAMALSSAVAGVVLAAAPATAASFNWYSAAEPLNASDDGTLRASAYGTSYQKNALLKNHTYYLDRRSNGNAVYTETSYSYYKTCSSGVVGWCPEVGKDKSARSSSSSWTDQYDQDDYSTRGADRGRVHSKVCEDQRLSGDPCSRKPYFTFSL